MSTNPGVTRRPSASITRAACPVLDHAHLGDPITIHGQVADGALGAGSVDDAVRSESRGRVPSGQCPTIERNMTGCRGSAESGPERERNGPAGLCHSEERRQPVLAVGILRRHP